MNTGALKITCRLDGPSLELVLSGEVDLYSCHELRTCLDAVPAGCREVVVDLARVTFMDSTGLHALCEARPRLEAKDRRLTVRNPTALVREVFVLTGLAEYFGVEPLNPVPTSA